MTRECRIGSVPWFAGCFWLAVSWAAHLVAHRAVRAGWLRLGWAAIRWSAGAARLAEQCAVEGGAVE